MLFRNIKQVIRVLVKTRFHGRGAPFEVLESKYFYV